MVLGSPSIGVETGAAQRARISRRWLRGVWLLAAGIVLAWSGRRAVLIGMGRFLVREDVPQSAEVIVVSAADYVPDAIEAGRLYGAGLSGEIVLFAAAPDPVQDEIRKLGGAGWTQTDYAHWLLERSGVPSGSITVLPDQVDGTGMEVAAIAAFVERRKPASVLYITPRSHTARIARLLGRALPARTHLLVTSPRTDAFNADSWWHSREQTRELTTEYLRCLNTFVLRDLWAR